MTHRRSENEKPLSESGSRVPVISLLQIVIAHLVMLASVIVIGGFATRSYIEHEQLDVAPVWSVLQALSLVVVPVSGWLIWNGYQRFAGWRRPLLSLATCAVVWQVCFLAYCFAIIMIHVELGGTL